jgi:hypothetical protein
MSQTHADPAEVMAPDPVVRGPAAPPAGPDQVGRAPAVPREPQRK